MKYGFYVMPYEKIKELFTDDAIVKDKGKEERRFHFTLNEDSKDFGQFFLSNNSANKQYMQQYYKNETQMREWVKKEFPGYDPFSEIPEEGSELTGTLKDIDDILQYKKQIILYGPPGTGKTYLANQYVQFMAQSSGNAFVHRCTFHPEYGYEHFIEGFKPEVSNDGTMFFRIKDGIFKSLCREAEKEENREKKFFLVIDEINRGDIPRIFGELITLIEYDKRGVTAALLPHSGKEFTVPPNVYIIGTMNTADRSIALLDTALRRRFGFIEMKPEYHHFKDIFPGKLTDEKGESCDLATWFKQLNDKLQEVLKSRHDTEDTLIGHSYFMQKNPKTENVELTQENFEQIIRYEILPLIQEYCYEDKEAREKLSEFITETTDFSIGERDQPRRKIRHGE